MSLPAMLVHLRADYGKRCILRDVQFELRAGEALGMVGILRASLVSAGSHKYAGSPKISQDLRGRNASDQVDVIVQYNQVPTVDYYQKVLSRGLKINRDLGRFKGGAYRIPASALADLAADPEVL
jgi:hypothetical protein